MSNDGRQKGSAEMGARVRTNGKTDTLSSFPLETVGICSPERVDASRPADTIRILLIDDHQLFLAGLLSVIESEPGLTVVAQAVNRVEAFAKVGTQPNIILLDLDLSGETSLDFLPDLLKAAEQAKVIVITGLPDPELHRRAVHLGAMGVVLKMETPALLVRAIRRVHAGEVWLSRSMLSMVVADFLHSRTTTRKADPDEEKIATLTAREREVIAFLAEGRRNKQIGEGLFISEKTVRHYLTSIFQKLGVKDRFELMIYSYTHGLVKIPRPPNTVAS